MAAQYNVTLVGHPDINMVCVRVKDHDARKYKLPPKASNFWQDLAGSKE